MGPPAWHVLSDEITQTTELRKSGAGLVEMFNIPYVVDSGPAIGHTGSVKLPVDNAGPDQVAAAINAQTMTVHTLGGLSQDENGQVRY